MSRRTILATVAALAVALAAVAVRAWPSASSSQAIPTVHAQRGQVEVTIHTTGEVRAARATPIFTPATGGQLQIVALAESGAAVHAGDVVVEFDSAEQAYNLEQARFDLDQATQEIVKADAAAAVDAAEDEVALLHARFDVRRAELDAGANELVGALQARENAILLEDARQRLAQEEGNVAVKRESSRASSAGLREKQHKAELAVRAAQHVLDLLRVRAPFDGYVTRRQNLQAFGGIIFSLAALPEYRVGDAAYSGQAIADLTDASRVEAGAKVSEEDRAHVTAGEPVDFAVDGEPSITLHGTVRAVSTVASRQLFDAGRRQFDVTVDLAGASVRPGVTGVITVHGPVLRDVVYVPRAAVFDMTEKPTVFVRRGHGFEPRSVRVRTLTESVAVLDDLDGAPEVALVNPTASGRAGAAAPSAAPLPQRASR